MSERALIEGVHTAMAELEMALADAAALHDEWLRQTELEQQRRLTDARVRVDEIRAAAGTTFKAVVREIILESERDVKRGGPPAARWTDALWHSWTPPVPGTAHDRLRLGDLVDASAEFATSNASVPSPRIGSAAAALRLPALLPFGTGTVVFEAPAEQRATVLSAIQNLLLRRLVSVPGGKLRFTFVDPIGLGQSVAPFMHLADHDEALVTGKAWTEPQHIEQRLTDLTEHMENVIQKYLRNQFPTIEAYNDQAGEVAEPYRTLVVFDFPASFTDTAARRLVSIAQNGMRCGVQAVVWVDPTRPLPYGFNLADLLQGATVIAWKGDRFVWDQPDIQECRLDLDGQPEPYVINTIISSVGDAAKRAARVEVPFERIAPPPDQWWTESSAGQLRAALGPAGARRIQELVLGHGTSQHVLIAGKTGSGKSTLLHTLIMSIALKYSPDEVRFYLVDFKKGVEFKTYAQHELPHARVIAIESEREFGLSVLQGLDDELNRRGELFRRAGVDALDDYRARTAERMPRILLLVDEFQEFFTEDDQVASQAGRILDRLVRQGRAFGVHVVLGSQTLAGAYSLARSTVDQMAVRIALQCSEADSRLILADDNPAARLLSRPGEAIYNAANGRVEGNNTFQVAWLADERRDRYLQSMTLMRPEGSVAPLVFEGNAPADLGLNHALSEAVTDASPLAAVSNTAWLGDPVAIREPIAVRFRPQSGSNLLVVAQDEASALGLLTSSLVSLAATVRPTKRQTAAGTAPEFHILDFSATEGSLADYLTRLAGLLGDRVRVVRRRMLDQVLTDLAAIIQVRLDTGERGMPLFLLVNGLQRARDLRQDDTFGFGTESPAASPAQLFATILRDGPEADVHTIVWCDTLTNLARTLDRRTQREFAFRVAFQMSAEDSANLLDNAAASRLGPYRALLLNEDEGRLEKFRPYAPVDSGWLETICQCLARRDTGLVTEVA